MEENYIRTLNRTGFSTRYVDAFAQAGLDFAKGKSRPALDIGCGFGSVSARLLEQGNAVRANDISREHLDALRDRATAEQRERLTLLAGAFPDAVKLAAGSLSCAISSWVIHFLSGEELVRAAGQLFDALEPGGKVFLSASSPYVKFLAAFAVEYEKRKSEGQPFPGWMEDVSAYLQPSQVENLPRSMHFLDPDVLRRVFGQAGFEIESATFFYRDDCTEAMALDGRENVGLIARKPAQSSSEERTTE